MGLAVPLSEGSNSCKMLSPHSLFPDLVVTSSWAGEELFPLAKTQGTALFLGVLLPAYNSLGCEALLTFSCQHPELTYTPIHKQDAECWQEVTICFSRKGV